MTMVGVAGWSWYPDRTWLAAEMAMFKGCKSFPNGENSLLRLSARNLWVSHVRGEVAHPRPFRWIEGLLTPQPLAVSDLPDSDVALVTGSKERSSWSSAGTKTRRGPEVLVNYIQLPPTEFSELSSLRATWTATKGCPQFIAGVQVMHGMGGIN